MCNRAYLIFQQRRCNLIFMSNLNFSNAKLLPIKSEVKHLYNSICDTFYRLVCNLKAKHTPFGCNDKLKEGNFLNRITGYYYFSVVTIRTKSRSKLKARTNVNGSTANELGLELRRAVKFTISMAKLLLSVQKLS